MADDLVSILRSLANRWALKARDLAAAAKVPNVKPDVAAYNRGLADGYYKAATEMAEVLKQQAYTAPPPRPATPVTDPEKTNPNAGGRWSAPNTANPPPVRQEKVPTPPRPAPTSANETVAPAPPSRTDANFLRMELGEVLRILQFGGTTPRDVVPRSDNSFHAIFSKWENLTPPQRIEKVKQSDFRLVILETGLLKDTRDPYIDFAFQEPS